MNFVYLIGFISGALFIVFINHIASSSKRINACLSVVILALMTAIVGITQSMFDLNTKQDKDFFSLLLCFGMFYAVLIVVAV